MILGARLPAMVTCARCGKVCIEAAPTQRRVVCAACVEAFVGGEDRCCVCDADLRGQFQPTANGRTYCEGCWAGASE